MTPARRPPLSVVGPEHIGANQLRRKDESHETKAGREQIKTDRAPVYVSG
jgi:hypothetical protein